MGYITRDQSKSQPRIAKTAQNNIYFNIIFLNKFKRIAVCVWEVRGTVDDCRYKMS